MSSLEDLFGKLAMTTVTTVSRIALNHATNAAIRNVTAYVTTQPKNKHQTRELELRQRQLDLRIKNLKPTIDIISRSVADGHRDLEPALEMCRDLKQEIDAFTAEMEEELSQKKDNTEYILVRLKRLLDNVDDVVPSLHLALRSLERDKPMVSRSKLVQTSSILQDARYGRLSHYHFQLRLYCLFAANVRAASGAEFTWKEEFHKCSLELKKTNDDPIDYTLNITEDLDDGLYHEELEQGQKTGKTLSFSVPSVKRMYYTRSGQLLNIEDSKAPVLVLKVAKPSKELSATEDDTALTTKEAKPEIERSELQEADWFAIEMWSDDPELDEEEEEEEEEENGDGDGQENKKSAKSASKKLSEAVQFPTSLLLLESVIKLGLLECSEQMDHLNASDELIDLYMA